MSGEFELGITVVKYPWRVVWSEWTNHYLVRTPTPTELETELTSANRASTLSSILYLL